jgi:hypothetical protein
MFYIGVDLGQTRDYSAIAVVQKESVRKENALPPHLLVRRVERIALGTPYPLVAARIRALTHEHPFYGRCALAVDATGVGAPVVDMLREPGLACDLAAVTITGGTRESRRGYLHFNVPKRDLISGVQLALEKGLLRIAGGMKEAASLIGELTAMQIGASTGEHDDLVLALALACWRARRKSVWGGGRLPGI